MGRKGGSKLLQREAKAIGEKLGAEIREGSKHTVAAVRFEGVLVANFGIRRGRREGHPHLPRQLFVSENEALKLARCDISRDGYFEIIRGKGKLQGIGKK